MTRGFGKFFFNNRSSNLKDFTKTNLWTFSGIWGHVAPETRIPSKFRIKFLFVLVKISFSFIQRSCIILVNDFFGMSWIEFHVNIELFIIWGRILYKSDSNFFLGKEVQYMQWIEELDWWEPYESSKSSASNVIHNFKIFRSAETRSFNHLIFIVFSNICKSFLQAWKKNWMFDLKFGKLFNSMTRIYSVSLNENKKLSKKLFFFEWAKNNGFFGKIFYFLVFLQHFFPDWIQVILLILENSVSCERNNWLFKIKLPRNLIFLFDHFRK